MDSTYTEMLVAVRKDSDLVFFTQNNSSNVLKSGTCSAEHPVCVCMYNERGSIFHSVLGALLLP